MRSTILLIALAAPAFGQQTVLPQPEPHAVAIGVVPTPQALSGRIVLPNGVPPPEAVLIEYSGPAESFAFWSDRDGQFWIPVEKFAVPKLANRAVPNFTGSRLTFRLPGVAERSVSLDQIQTAEGLNLGDVHLNFITPQSTAMLSN